MKRRKKRNEEKKENYQIFVFVNLVFPRKLNQILILFICTRLVFLFFIFCVFNYSNFLISLQNLFHSLLLFFLILRKKNLLTLKVECGASSVAYQMELNDYDTMRYVEYAWPGINLSFETKYCRHFGVPSAKFN